MKSLLFSLTLSAGLALACAGPAAAAEVEERIENGSLSFIGGQGFSNAVLSITGPGDYEREETAIRGLPVFRARNSGRLLDGFYQYALTAATEEKVKIKNPLDNGRGEAARNYLLKPFSMHGHFQVKDGTIVAVKEAEGGADSDSVEEK